MNHPIMCDCTECVIRDYEKQIKRHRTDIEIIEARIGKLRKENRPE